ncbi:MAG TPA: STAS domain-containing protein [Verrucomicrobiae bacterium]|nr:STAS domain-containing protein [Verrucomicrobiae bacterium]
MTDPASSSTKGFQVHCFESDGALVAECHGRLIFENTTAFKEVLRDRFAGYKRLVIDLKEVSQMDSSGLGAIVGLYVSARTRGCRVELVNASQQIRDLFSLTNILSLFEPAGRYHGKTL